MSNTMTMQCRLGKDPETTIVGDTTVTKLWVAESEKFKKKDGEKVEATNWWGCEIWGASGETFAKYHNKGDGCLLTGSMRQHEHNDKTYNTLRVNTWEFVMSRKSDGGQSPAAQASGVADVPGDDAIPF